MFFSDGFNGNFAKPTGLGMHPFGGNVYVIDSYRLRNYNLLTGNMSSVLGVVNNNAATDVNLYSIYSCDTIVC